MIINIWHWEKYCCLKCHQKMATNVGEKRLKLGIRRKVRLKTCVPLLEHAGGRDASKSGLSILKFSANVPSCRPFGLKTLKIRLKPWFIIQTWRKIKKNVSKFLIWSKIWFSSSIGPKNREEKELRGENGAFDTETSTFYGAREVRSAWKRPKIGERRFFFKMQK